MPDLFRPLRRLRQRERPSEALQVQEAQASGRRRVMMIVHDPLVPASSSGSRHGQHRLSEHFGWNSAHALAQAYCEEVSYCSYGYAAYQIVEKVDVDAFPAKTDGFTYDAGTYLHAWRAGRFHQPDTADYLLLARQFGMADRIREGIVDEVWLFGFPYAGYYESVMAGPGAFWCNAPPLRGLESSGRRFVIMGFSYERGVGEMLENLGHRVESIMAHVFAGLRREDDLWERFTRYDLSSPGRAECGNVHFAPNSRADYDWGNPRAVPSRCDTWLSFPDLRGEPRPVDCREWGNGDILAHHRWWLRHLPHVPGASDGMLWNWWQYVLDPERVPV